MLGCHSPFWIGTEGFSLCTRTHILQPAPAYFIFSALLLFALTRVWKWYKAHYAHGRIHLDLGQQKDSQTPTQSAVQEAENVILEKSAIDEELNILDSLNLKDQLSVIDPPSQNSKWSAGAALVLTVSWSLPVLLVISTTQPGHSYAPLLGLSSVCYGSH